MRLVRFLAAAGIFLATIVVAAPQRGGAPAAPAAPVQVDGAAVFTRACASCHQAGQAGVPTMDALRAFTPEAIVNALTNGKMSAQGATLSVAERASIAQFLTGRAPVAASSIANRCTTPTPTIESTRGLAGMNWTSWGNDAANSRYAPANGLTAADLPRLKLKWAFGYDGATTARPQPAMAGGKVFVGSDNAEVHALDPRTGCAYWTFKAEVGVRSGLTVGPYRSGGQTKYAVFFGDQRANAYALDTITGQQVWKRKVDDYPAAAITGSLTIQDGKVFVPVQGLSEEGSGGRGQTPCCKFRGNLAALNADTGALIWRTYMVDEPQSRGRNTRSGQEAFGPAGGAIWSSPTVDLTRRSVYVSTGNAYADPAQPMTDAIVAMDIDSGKVKWVYQATANDNWLGGCGARSGGNPGCPEVQGPDHDFSASPLLATVDGKQLLITPQKSGMAHALDPQTGKLVWQYRFGQGSGLGGVWGAAADGRNIYFGVSDGQSQNPGGVRAARLTTGEQIWSVPGPNPRLCAAVPRCTASQGAAVTLIPGAVLAGSHDGGLRAYSTEDGKVLWEFDTNKTFTTVNKVMASGASIDGSPLIVAEGMVFVNSGYGGIAARPGNVLLAFGLE
jgi:polyvinyl alcohol dehydrogenase (cytochrome)